MLKDSTVLYADTVSGFASAYSAWTRLGNSANYIVADSLSVPKVIGKILYIFGIPYALEKLVELAESYEEIVFIDDHHKSFWAIREKNNYEKIYLDYAPNSCCALVYRYFNGTKNPGMSLIMDYIGDAEASLFNYSDSREVWLGIIYRPRDFFNWGTVNLSDMKAEGREIMKTHDNLLTNMVSNSSFTKFSGWRVPIVHSNVFIQDVGKTLLKKHNNNRFSIVYNIIGSRVMVYLIANEGFDVLELDGDYKITGERDFAKIEMDVSEFVKYLK